MRDISRSFDHREAQKRLQQDRENWRDYDGQYLRNRSKDQFQHLAIAHTLPHSLTSTASDSTELVSRLLLFITTLLRHYSERVEEKRSANPEYV